MRRGTTTENLSLLRDRLAGIEIALVAEVGSIDITMRDVLQLRAGDIIRLQNVRVSDPMMLKIGDRRKFLCRPGVVGNKIAVQVLKKLEDIEQAEFEELVADEGEEA
jgi:flagellar motor switch protein FliM